MGYPESSNTYSINWGEMLKGTALGMLTVDELEDAALAAGVTPIAYMAANMENSVEAAAQNGVS